MVTARLEFYDTLAQLAAPFDTPPTAAGVDASLLRLRECASALHQASLTQSSMSERWAQASTAALSALSRLPPPRRNVAEREALLASVTAQLQRPHSGLIVATALEARGAAILAETADAISHAEPLQRTRELRRLAAPVYLALVDALEAAAAGADKGSVEETALGEGAARLTGARETLGALSRLVKAPPREVEEVKEEEVAKEEVKAAEEAAATVAPGVVPETAGTPIGGGSGKTSPTGPTAELASGPLLNEIDDSIARERSELQRERERLQARRERRSAPATSVGAALHQLRTPSRATSSASSSPQSPPEATTWLGALNLIAGGGMRIRRVSGSGLGWGRLSGSHPYGGGLGKAGAVGTLPTVPASPAVRRDDRIDLELD